VNEKPEILFSESELTGIYFNGKEYRWCEDGKDVRKATKEDFAVFGIEYIVRID
jgi:hypothetical protein